MSARTLALVEAAVNGGEVGEGPLARALRALAVGGGGGGPLLQMIVISYVAPVQAVALQTPMNVYVLFARPNTPMLIQCPAAAIDGDTFTVKGDSLNEIIVGGNGKLIDGAVSYPMPANPLFSATQQAATFAFSEDFDGWIVIWNYPGSGIVPPP